MRRAINCDVSCCGVQGSEFKSHAGNNIIFTFIVCDYPRNIISNIIRIFNVYSTKGNLLVCIIWRDSDGIPMEPTI